MASLAPPGSAVPTARDRIVDATIEVISENGVAGLRHRLIAKAAGVPLGSTTYYFPSLEALMAAAFQRAVQRELESLRHWCAQLPLSGDGLVEALASAAVEATDRKRAQAIVLAELYTAALRRKPLRLVALEWERSWDDLLASRLNETTARAVSSSVTGLMQRSLLEERPLELRDTESLLRQIIN